MRPNPARAARRHPALAVNTVAGAVVGVAVWIAESRGIEVPANVTAALIVIVGAAGAIVKPILNRLGILPEEDDI